MLEINVDQAYIQMMNCSCIYMLEIKGGRTCISGIKGDCTGTCMLGINGD